MAINKSKINLRICGKKNTMSKLKADNLAKAIRQLPKPKTYPAETITVLIEKHKYIFQKTESQWYFVI